MKKGISILLSTFISALSLTNIVSGNFISAQEQDPVEIISLRSEYEKHFDNGDGTMTAFIDTVPLHYYNNGSWVEIDNTIVEDEYGNYVNKSNSMDVTLLSTTSVEPISSVDDEQMVSIDYNGYSISWDFVNDQPLTADYDSIENMSIPKSHILINESYDIYDIDSEESQLSKITSEPISKLESSVSYNSIFNDVDVDIDIRSNSVKETIILNNKNSAPEKFTYYIKAKNLNAEIYDDNSIYFFNESDEDIFKIPTPYMFDSSDNIENNYDIKFTIEDYDEGYLLTLIPDRDWILSDERVYPIMIDPEIKVQNNEIKFSYNSEANAGLTYSENYMKVGNELNNSYQTYAEFNLLFSGFHENITVVNANLNMHARPISLSNSKKIDVYSLNSEPRGTCWAVDSQLDSFNTYISSFEVLNSSNYRMYSIDVTSLAQSWLNNIKTRRTGIGVPSYGIKMVASSTPKATVEFYTGSAALKPYCIIDYVVDTDYTLHYAPYKYNDIYNKSFGKINNFQNRMNCYSYALQAYYNGTESYMLYPGEIGIGHHVANDNYDTLNFGELKKYYNSFEDSLQYKIDEICNQKDVYLNHIQGIVGNDERFIKIMNDYMTFVENQMRRDAQVIDFNIKKYNNSAVLDQSSIFTPPNNYNENNERVIAMIAYYLYEGRFKGTLTYHYYLRNGNGTCPLHSGNCSMWSQKMGNSEVSNVAYNKGIICDKTIYNYSYSIKTNKFNNAYNNNLINFYSITKDTNVYDSFYGNGHFNDSTGTTYTKYQ